MPITARLWLGAGAALASVAAVIAAADPLPPSATYRNLPTLPFDTVKANDAAVKARVSGGSDCRTALRPVGPADPRGDDVRRSKAVQGGVRVKLPEGVSWDSLAQMTPSRSAKTGCCRPVSCRCRMSKQATGGQVFPND